MQSDMKVLALKNFGRNSGCSNKTRQHHRSHTTNKIRWKATFRCTFRIHNDLDLYSLYNLYLWIYSKVKTKKYQFQWDETDIRAPSLWHLSSRLKPGSVAFIMRILKRLLFFYICRLFFICINKFLKSSSSIGSPYT